jgi:hypothetical protein
MARPQQTDDYYFEGVTSPNTTPVPDVVFDRLLARLKEAELKALLYIIRRTFGFKRGSDSISFNQFLRGITTRDGRVLDEGCGVKDRTTLSNALKSLEKKGIVVSTKGMDERGENQTTVYALRFKPGDDANGKEDGDGMEIPEGVVGIPYHPSRNYPPPVVGNSYPQETGKQQTEIADSNIRKSNSSNDDFVDNSASQWISAGGEHTSPRNDTHVDHAVEGIGSIMARIAPTMAATAPIKRSRGRSRKLPNVSPEIYEAVVGVMQDYTRKLGDGEHIASNITQAINLIVASGCDFNTFYMHVIDAYKTTSQRNGLENRSRYFFAVLRDSLLPSDTVGDHTA